MGSPLTAKGAEDTRQPVTRRMSKAIHAVHKHTHKGHTWTTSLRPPHFPLRKWMKRGRLFVACEGGNWSAF